MIRANFHIDPARLYEEEWAMLFQQACWVENFRLSGMARLLAALFAPTKE